jgi:endogenous inhibitor of DNA gyrase (YacG/DUF329 family)
MLCKHCNKPVDGKYSKNKYCSAKCAQAYWRVHNKERVKEYRYEREYTPVRKGEHRCEVCGAAFHSFATYAKYCSRSCKTIANHKNRKPYQPVKRNCVWCSGEIRNGGISYCSDECKDLAKKNAKGLIKKTCPQCGKEFTAKSARRKFCSLRCKFANVYSRKVLRPDWNDRERERLSAYAKTEKGKEKQRRHEFIRRNRKKGVPATFTEQDWETALEYFKYKCVYCDAPLTKAHREHFVPLARGGGYTKDNILPACSRCNCKKSDQDPIDWLSSQVKGLIAYARIMHYFNSVRKEIA